MFFAALLTFGVLAPVAASAHGYPMLRATGTTVDEGDYGYSTAWVKISLNHRTNHGVSVGWSTHHGTAMPFSDYKPTGGRVYIPKFHKGAWVHVHVVGDKTVEPDEFFFVKLFRPHGAGISYYGRYAKVWIENDDVAPVEPKLNVRDAQVVAGGDVQFKVELSKPAAQLVTFNYKTEDHTAVAPTDYTGVAYGSGTIAAGSSGTTVTVPTKAAGAGKDFYLKVFHVQGAVRDDGFAIGSILSLPRPRIWMDTPASVVEGSPVTVNVHLSAATPGVVTVDFATENGTAVEPGDYTSVAKQLSFSGNSVVVPVLIQTNDDGDDASETFKVKLASATNADIVDPVDTVTILAK